MNIPRIKKAFLVLGVPTAYALIVRLFFGVRTWDDMFTVMSISFLLCLPTIMGVLVVYLSSKKKVEDLGYRCFMPWIPVLIFLLITLLLAWEGWACWLMVLPLFLVAASVGGLIGGYFKLKKKENTLNLSILTLLPVLLSPIEHFIGAESQTYKAYTSIDIKAPASKIWRNVTRVKAISPQQDKGWLTQMLGFPRPIKAELNYEGVGAYRAATFTRGLTFHETVTEYMDQKKMIFSIKAYPHEIPSTTMDEHVVIGGQYFDVLNGTYELEQLTPTTFRLHLYSHFRLTTTFNFYAGWWAELLMKDIQNTILLVEKERAESADSYAQPLPPSK